MPSNFERFIVENAEADISRLLLSCTDWPSVEDSILGGSDGKELAVNTIEGRRKIRDKVPEWYGITSLVYPTALCTEQCSSSATARYKAALAGRILGDSQGRIADLTGGLGVDSWAFSEVASEVLYNEREPGLAAAAKHNLLELGVRNVRFSNLDIDPGTIGAVLSGFDPDIIFLDPARRSSEGNKVFLLEDCSPDVLSLLPSLLSVSRHLLLKLSPMADISMVVERIDHRYEGHLESAKGSGWNGNWVREIHVVSSGGECKELLVWVDREWKGEYSVICREDGGTLSFGVGEIKAAKPKFPDAVYFKYLFEPGKSLSKAGVWNVLCERFGLAKLARSTNLFTLRDVVPPAANDTAAPCAPRPIRVNGRGSVLPPESAPVILNEVKDLYSFGKLYKVEEVMRLDKRALKEVGKRFPHAEVTARNIPLTSQELRARLGVKSGDDAHIFGVKVETPFDSSNFLLVCHRI